MIFSTPTLGDELEVVRMIDELRERLRSSVIEPRRWIGSLRRLTLARAVQGSNSIEGYDATLDDVVAALAGDEPLDASTETRLALDGYCDAMTYVLQLARGGPPRVELSLLSALQFMMIKHDLSKNPGRLRPGAIYVRRDDGQVVYEGPDVEAVPALLDELIHQLNSDNDGPVLVRAAMAHLNLVMIHPFSDGNGRMARCLQTLLLARERILSPEFNSIEEYFGRNTQSYYDVLAQVGQGTWNPHHDARPWLRFSLTAHYHQARTILRRIQESEELWEALTTLVNDKSLPERTVGPLFDAAQGLRLRNATYRSTVLSSEGEEISEQTASRDLKNLVDKGLLVATGEKRGRVYSGAPITRATWTAIRARRPPRDAYDPFADAAQRQQLRLRL